MIKYTDLKPSIKLNDISQLESKYQISFPEQYKNHLLRYNGGTPEPSIFLFNEQGRQTNSRVKYFYAINSGEVDDLEEVIEIFKIEEKRMPNHILPIADDPFGNVVCISSGESDYGYVYFWNHEKEIDYNVSDDSDYTNLYFIASSFNLFIDSLKEDISG